MNEYIFGDLANPQKAAAFMRKQRLGVRHNGNITPRMPGPTDRPLVSVNVGLDVALESVICILMQPEPMTITLNRISIEWDMLNWSYRQQWQGALPAWPEGTLVRYRLEAHPSSGGDPIPADEGACFSYLVGDYLAPNWATGALIYQIFPDRFHPGAGNSWRQQSDIEDVFGGTLRGIIEGLDHVAGLGFNCLWLNPFHPDETHHGYHATDHYSVNPRLGSLQDMRELVERAHGLGIRLLLDFVPNHCGADHPYFQDAVSRADSPYRDWFTFNSWPDDYEMYYQVRDLPKINVDNPEAREYLVGSACYWLGEIGFDGLRLDHAHGPTLDFWTDLRLAVAKVKPDAWLFGEVTLPPSRQVIYEGLFHGNLDFLLAESLRRAFAFGTMGLAAFDAFIELHEAYFPPRFNRPSFLDNHDMDRFLLAAGGDKRKLKLAALCQFTLAGQPIVYYGTEVGVRQERFINKPDGRGMAEARQPMLWGDAQDADLREYYRWLLNFRSAHPVLWRGRRQTVHLDEKTGTYAYLRADDRDRLVVAFNTGDKKSRFEAAGEHFELSPLAGEVRIIKAR